MAGNLKRVLLHAACPALLALFTLVSCTSKERTEQSAKGTGLLENASNGSKEPPDAMAKLRAYESQRRAQSDFGRLPSSHANQGADPYRIVELPDQNGYLSILRGDHSLVWLDADLNEKARLPAPKSPTGLAVTARGEVFVTGELSPFLARFQFQNNALVASGRLRLPSPCAPRDIAVSEKGVLYIVEEKRGGLISIVPKAKAPGSFNKLNKEADLNSMYGMHERWIGNNPVQVRTSGDFVFVNGLLDHEIAVVKTDSNGVAEDTPLIRIKHDGPFFGFDIKPFEKGFLIAAGGVENHKLDRSDGAFGYIDSFLYLYTWSEGEQAKKIREVNVSEHGIITPKAVVIEKAEPGQISIRVSGYGGFQLGRAIFRGDAYNSIEFKSIAMVPGISDLAYGSEDRWAAANPLLDTWILGSKDSQRMVKAEQSKKSEPPDRRRLGEALFFTALMAPKNRTEGPLSRFTCETCHFEGYVDGRTHHTGRADVHATTKALLGLFNNRPHFSRALDPDLSAVAHNEFRVAGAKSGHDPWFSIRPREYAWTERLLPEALWKEADTLEIGPEELRLSLMDFLMAFTHRPNPSVIERKSFNAQEKRGAEIFKAKCESCHCARLSADEPGSAIPFDEWEKFIFSEEGPLVWASAEYQKTGVLPYMHERGTRTPSLRRLFKKHPFFTNGSAKDPITVIAGSREVDGVFYHLGGPQKGDTIWEPEAEEYNALAAFLDLL